MINSLFKKMSGVDTAFILAIITGLIYVFGYIYYETYYSRLGMDLTFFVLPTSLYLIYGFIFLFDLVMFSIVVLLAIGAYRLLRKASGRNVHNKKLRNTLYYYKKLYKYLGLVRYEKRLKNEFKGWLPELKLATVLGVVSFVVAISIGVHGNAGRVSGDSFLKGKCILSAVSFYSEKNKFSDSKKMCLVTVNNGNYWFLDIDKNMEVIKEVVMKPKASIVCFRSLGSLFTYKNNHTVKEFDDLKCSSAK